MKVNWEWNTEKMQKQTKGGVKTWQDKKTKTE